MVGTPRRWVMGAVSAVVLSAAGTAQADARTSTVPPGAGATVRSGVATGTAQASIPPRTTSSLGGAPVLDLPETLTTRAVAPNNTLTTIDRGSLSPSDYYT